MRTKRRMSAADFAAVRPFLKIAAARIEAARRVLVDGETMQAAGKEHKWSRQAVCEAVDVVWAALARYRASQEATRAAAGGLPPGWDSVTLVAPAELIVKFREDISKATKRLTQDKPAPTRPKKS